MTVLPAAPPAPPRRWRGLPRWFGALALVALAAFAGHQAALHTTLERLREAADHRLDMLTGALDADLTRFEHLPALLEIVGDGQRGASFPAGDADALAQVLADLAADPGRRERLARAGREWVLEHRTWRAAAARYRQVYEVAALSATRSSAATNS